MQTSDAIQQMTVFVDLHQGPLHVRNLGLHDPRILQQVAQLEEQFRLHPTNNVDDVPIPGAESPEFLKAESNTSKWFAWPLSGTLD